MVYSRHFSKISELSKELSNAFNTLAIYASILNKKRNEYIKNEILTKVAELISSDYGINDKELIDIIIDEVLTYIEATLPEARILLTSNEVAKYMKELINTYKEIKEQLNDTVINISSSIITTLIRTGKIEPYRIDEVNIQKFTKVLIESAISATLNQALMTYLQLKKREISNER